MNELERPIQAISGHYLLLYEHPLTKLHSDEIAVMDRIWKTVVRLLHFNALPFLHQGLVIFRDWLADCGFNIITDQHFLLDKVIHAEMPGCMRPDNIHARIRRSVHRCVQRAESTLVGRIENGCLVETL